MMYKVAIEDIEKEKNKTLHYIFDDNINEFEDCKVYCYWNYKHTSNRIVPFFNLQK